MSKLERYRAALEQIATGNPAPVGKWLSDIQMADIARVALKPPTAKLERYTMQELLRRVAEYVGHTEEPGEVCTEDCLRCHIDHAIK